jgi:hypothetical protein
VLRACFALRCPKEAMAPGSPGSIFTARAHLRESLDLIASPSARTAMDKSDQCTRHADESTLSSKCSMMCADHPAIRDSADTGMSRSTSIPSRLRKNVVYTLMDKQVFAAICVPAELVSMQ